MSAKVPAFQQELLDFIASRQYTKTKWMIRQLTNVHELIDDRNFTLLHYAAQYDNNVIAEYLIELGCHVDAQDYRGKTPLMLAVEEERLLTIQVLLQNNANIHVTDESETSALQMVVHRTLYSQSTMEVFLKQLRDETPHHDSSLIAQKLREIGCPLRVAVLSDDAQVTRLMLDAGNCKIDEPDFLTGKTALHVSVCCESFENVKLLVEYGANVNAQTVTGYTPLHYLRFTFSENLNLQILKILLDGGAMIFTARGSEKTCQVLYILKSASRKFIHLLMQYDVDLCAADRCGYTVLHYLAFNEHAGVFDELQGKKFDVNARDDAFCTPLLLVTKNYSSLKFLTVNGADVNASTRGGTTSLNQTLCLGRIDDEHHTERVESVKILLLYGANPQPIFADDKLLDYTLTEHWFELIQPVLASLILLGEKGTPITEFTVKKICRKKLLKEYYDFCKNALSRMKTTIVWESITQFKLLTVSDKQRAIYMRQQDFRDAAISNMPQIESCYEYFMREYVNKAISTAVLWEKSTAIFCDVFKLPYGKYYGVIENIIISYLTEQDMRNLCLIGE